jgi:hypothetical protein
MLHKDYDRKCSVKIMVGGLKWLGAKTNWLASRKVTLDSDKRNIAVAMSFDTNTENSFRLNSDWHSILLAAISGSVGPAEIIFRDVTPCT